MADGYMEATQSALIAAMLADPDLSDLVDGRIVDEPRQDEPLPYIRLGDLVPIPDDTDGTEGATVQVGIEVHSRPVAGRVEAARICGAIFRRLHRRPDILSVSPFSAWDMEVQTSTVTRTADGAGYTGTLALVVSLDT